jgi:hypothetical protein
MKILSLILTWLFLIQATFAQQNIKKLNVDELKLPTESASKALYLDGSNKIKSSATVDDTELSYLDGTTSSVQTQINSKQATITGAASTVTTSNLTPDRAVTSDGSGKITNSAVTATELGYVSGATSSIQTQINTNSTNISGNTSRITTLEGYDKVLEYVNFAGFPGTGATATLYLDKALNKLYRWNGSAYALVGDGTGTGDVVGPASATDTAIAIYDGATGKLIKNSTVTINSSGDVSANSISAPSTATTSTLSGVILNNSTVKAVTGANLDVDAVSATSGINLKKKTTFWGRKLHVTVDDASTGSNVTLADHAVSVVRLTGSGLVSIDGIPAGNGADTRTIINVTGADININHDTGATAANRFYTGTGANLRVKNNSAVQVTYDQTKQRWYVTSGAGSGSGVGDADLSIVQDFESAGLTDFTHTGLTLDISAPLHGTTSGKLISQAGSTQSFKQVIALDKKFRGKNITLKVDCLSAATSGNITISVYDETNAASLMSASQLLCTTTENYFTFSFDSVSTTASMSYTITTAAEAGTPASYFDDIAIGLTKVPVYAAVVQQYDSMVRVQGGTGYGSTNTKIRRFTNLLEQRGSDILFSQSATLGDSFTVLTDGTYHISAVDTAAGIDETMGISKNTTQPSTNIGSLTNKSEVLSIATVTSGSVPQAASWTGYLLANDVVRMHNHFSAATNTAYATMTVAKIGSLKQTTVNSNQKIKIPSSEIRFVGASARGSTDTGVVKYDTLEKIRGDAFTVVNTAANGTAVTTIKPGKADIYATVRLATGGIICAITKNQTTLTTLNVSATTENLNSSVKNNIYSDAFPMSASTTVAAGDVFRVSCDGGLTSYASATFNIYHQEQEVQVSVANTLPQYSENDQTYRVDTASGFGSTNTKVRRFANVRENTATDFSCQDSATLGLVCTVSKAGTYSVSYTATTDSGTPYACIAKNLNTTEGATGCSSVVATATDKILANAQGSGATVDASSSWTGTLVAGETILPHGEAGPNSVRATRERFTMSRIGKPNVTGVDITAFANVKYSADTDWTSFTPTGTWTTNATYTGKWKRERDEIVAQYYVQLSGAPSAGVQLKLDPVAGYPIDTTKILMGADPDARVFGDGSVVDSGVQYYPAKATYDSGKFYINRFSTATGTNSVPVTIGGGVFDSTPFAWGNGDYVQVTVRYPVQGWSVLEDHILTPVQSFSTDTDALTWASSSTYTQTTLANAPKGTFITWSFATGLYNTTQCTAAPTQTTSDMAVNGILMYGRAYNATASCLQPAKIAIKIGAGHKGKLANIFKSAGKLIPGDIDWKTIDASISIGAFTFYDDKNGILIIDSGFNWFSTTTSHTFTFSDGNQQSSGYVVINTSKSPSLTGVTPVQIIPYSADEVITTADFSNSTGTTVVCSSSPCTINSKKGGEWLTSITWGSLGNYQLNLSTTYWKDVTKVNCWMPFTGGVVSYHPFIERANSSGVMNFYGRQNTGTYASVNFYGTIYCSGQAKK